jgi:hypothetical protein
MVGVRALVVAVALALVGPGAASAFVKCQMPDGRLLFVDVPPPGCVVKGEMKNSEPAEPPSEPSTPGEDAEGEAGSGSARSDSGDAQAIAGARRIERELDSAADELDRVKQDRENAPKSPPGIYVDVNDGSSKFEENERVQPDVAAQLDAREKEVLERIQGLRDEYATLTTDVEKQNGGRAPPWWSSTPRCPRCP